MFKKKCTICGRALNNQTDELSLDCGGDCWGCVGEFEANAGDDAALAKVREEAARGLRPNWEDSPKAMIASLDSWIIQDGNYGDFSIGDTARFALEFFGQLQVSSTSFTKMEHIEGGRYRVNAKVTYSRKHVWVLDFGLRAFSESVPPEFALQGSWVRGEIEIGIDPFFYKEQLHREENMPNLFYDWTVSRIERNDSPWIETANASGGKMLNIDEQNERWIDIQQTDAWSDDDGRASYLLHLK
jgi:hypothetical protein